MQISTADISTKAGCEELLKTAAKSGPVVAIFNLAAVLSDASLKNQSTESFVNCLKKAVFAKHLDQLSRTMCPSLQ